MIQWAATICCWILLGLLWLTDYARWAVYAAAAFIGLVGVIVVGGGIAGRVRRLRRSEAAPAPDFAFLANCLWCADLSEDPADCTCTRGCTEVEWCVARYDATNTSIGAIPVYREDS